MDILTTYLITLLPSATAILTTAGTLIAFLKNFKTLRSDVKSKVEMEELRAKLEASYAENLELQKLLKKDIEVQTKIKEE